MTDTPNVVTECEIPNTIDNREINATEFSDDYVNGTPVTQDWASFAAQLIVEPTIFPDASLTPDGCPTKYKKPDAAFPGPNGAILPGFAPACFKGGYRTRDNVLSVSATAIEYDGTLSFDDAEKVYGKLASCIYTSFNHMHDGRPRIRVVVLNSRDVTADEHALLWDHLESLAGVEADHTTRKADRFWYLPGCPESRKHLYKGRVFEGPALDVDAVLSATPDVQIRAKALPLHHAPASVERVPETSLPEYLEQRASAVAAAAREAFPGPGEGRHRNLIGKLAGACESEGSLVPREHALAFIEAVIDRAGFENAENKLTFAKYILSGSGDKTTGFPNLRAFAPLVCDAFTKGAPEWQPKKKAANDSTNESASAPTQARMRRQYRRDHTYSLVVGESAVFDPRAAIAKPLIAVAKELSQHHAWAGVLAWDALRKQVIAVNPPVRLECEQVGSDLTEIDVLAIRMWLEVNGTKLKKEEARGVIESVARGLSFDPIVEYLDTCAASRSPGILDSAASRLFGNDEAISQKWFKQFLVGCARRGLKPGTKHDEALILYGAQAFKKSTFVELLFGADYTLTQRLDLDDVRKTGEFLKDKWGAELPELTTVQSATLETVKHFLTTTIDEYQPPFGRRNVRVPRRTCFIGTTNAPQFLSDPTGGRRFLVIEVMKKIDLEWLRQNLSALWGDAVFYARLPTSLERPDLAGTDQVFDHWDEDLTDANAAREQFTIQDEWHDDISQFLWGKANVTVAEVWERALAGKAQDMGKKEGDRIRGVLAFLGCRPAKRTNGRRGFNVPDCFKNRIADEPATPPASTFKGASSVRLGEARDEQAAQRRAANDR